MIILSLITVVKNNKKKAELTFKSVFSQNINFKFEYIVFDGNSTDGLHSLIKKYQKENFKFIRKKDSSFYDGLNQAIKSAKGKYIAILNAGDIFCKSQTLNEINKILRLNPDYIYSNVYFYQIINKNLIINRIWKSRNNCNNSLNYINIPHTSLIIKKKIIKEVNYYDTNFKISSDLDFLIKISKLKKKKYLFLNNFTVYMLNGGLSTSFKYLKKKIIEDLFILYKNYRYFSLCVYIYKVFSKLSQFLIEYKKINTNNIKNLITKFN